MSPRKTPSPSPFSWWEKQTWKPQPPAAAETDRPGTDDKGMLPQGDEKWRLNNPKKRRAEKK